ncbi:hypothetical protein [Streptomyces sp. NPDC059743]|uniref:hypothetical protein n=1 Tax=Streptomyces sp. NPDC059743 TaxID=3346928 RepID=UPI00365A0DAF
MGHEGGEPYACDPDPRSDPHSPDDEARCLADGAPDAVAYIVGGLLIELGEKIRRAGAEGVRILTDDELQRDQLAWFRAGWAEHTRATSPDQADHTERAAGHHPDSENFPVPPPRLLHFPNRRPAPAPTASPPPDTPRPHHPDEAREHHQPNELRLPTTGAGEAQVRHLMRSRQSEAGNDPPDGEPG